MARRKSLNKKQTIAIVIAVVAIVLIAAIVLGVLYVKQPDTFNALLNSILGDNSSQNSHKQEQVNLTDGDLYITFLNMGQGDSIYIQFPDGKDMLIDCGNKSSGYSYATTKSDIDALNPDGQIDYLMLTHCDEDHVDQMDNIIKDYVIKNIYMPNVLAAPSDSTLATKVNNLGQSVLSRFTDPNTINTAVYAKFFIAAFTETDCNVYLNVDDNDSTNNIKIIGETYSLIFYCPTYEDYAKNTLKNAEEKNAISPVGILSYNGRKIVLTGDANEETEENIIPRLGNIDCDVLKVGHHGSSSSTTVAFLNTIKCEYAVISCNYWGNTFQHPRQDTLDRLILNNYTIFRTDLNGNITLHIDSQGQILFSTTTSATVDQERNGISSQDINDIQAIKDQGLPDEQEDNLIAAIVGYTKIGA